MRDKMRQNMVNILIWAVFLLAYLPQASGHVYWSASRQFLTMIFMTLGLMAEMISGVLDLSFMAEISAATCVGAYLLRADVPLPVVLSAMVCFHLAVGAVKGFLVSRLPVSPILITLALQIMLSNGFGIFTGDAGVMFGHRKVYASGWFWLEVLAVLLALSCFFSYILKRTYYGKYIRMLGENRRAVGDSGLPETAIRIIVSMAASLFFCVASVILLFITSSGSPSNGSYYLYPVIAAASLGGGSFLNGRGRVSGAYLGTVSIVMCMHMTVFWGLQSAYETILMGILIILSLPYRAAGENN